MNARRRALFTGYLPWAPLMPAALVAAGGFSLELTLFAGSRAGALWSLALATAVGTLAAWGEARGADRARVELSMQQNGIGDANQALGVRPSMLVLFAMTLASAARALGLAALPDGAPLDFFAPSSVSSVLVGLLAFQATRGLARWWSLKRGDAPQTEPRDHLFTVPGTLACIALCLLAAAGSAPESHYVWIFALAGALLIGGANHALTRRRGTDVFAVTTPRR